MDDPGLDAVSHRAALRELARLNRLTRMDRLIWNVVRPIAAASPAPLRILDVATGAGDLPNRLAALAAREGVSLQLTACDMSDLALDVARRNAAAANVEISLFRFDFLAGEAPTGFDVAHCGLFLHHFDPPEVEIILRKMSHAASTVIVQDLRRTRLGLAMAWAAPRLLGRSQIVRVDAVRSVQGAYTIEEMNDMALRAGLVGARVRAVWPGRQLLIWKQGRAV